MSSEAPVAQTLACVNCGGAVPVSGAATVECPYCHRNQPVPNELLTKVRRYQSEAWRLQYRMDTARSEKSTWEFWYDKDGKPKAGGLKAVVLFMGPTLLVMGICYPLMLNHVVDQQTMGPLMTIGILGSYVLGFVVYVARVARRKTNPTHRDATVVARCAQCGGALPFELGAAGCRCPNCGDAAMAATQVMDRALGEAELQLKRERIERYRLERKAISHVYGYSAGNKVVYIVVGSFLLPLGGGTLAFTVQAITGNEDVPVGALSAMWGLTACLVGVLLCIREVRAARRRRIRVMAGYAADELAGDVLSRVDVWVTWLNAYWNGPYPIQNLYTGPAFCVVLGTVDDYPLAVDIDPVPFDSQHGKARTNLLLAANVPNELDCSPVPKDLRGRAHSLGFTLSSNSAGFCATGTQARELFKNTPDKVASTIVTVAKLLSECARRAGVGPSSPLP